MSHRLTRIRPVAVRIASGLLLALAAGWPGVAKPPGEPPAAATYPVRRLGPSPDRFEGEFAARLRAADPGRRFTALVDLTEQLDVRVLAKQLRAASATKAATRTAVISAFEGVASRQQAKLQPLLDQLVAAGSIAEVRSVAVVNRLIVAGTPAGLVALASSPEVALIRPDWTSERAASREAESAVPLGTSFRSWAIEAMKADRLWRLGYDGTGVTVAIIDTGAFESHEQLRLRRLPGERGWFDPVEGSTTATDRHGHGTGVLSQAVGGNPEGRVVGIAPGARWAAAAGNWKDFYSRSRMTLAADWALRVARPDVLINAWSHDEGPCNDFDRPFIDAWKASGIFVVFPAGNAGPARASGESPAQLGGIFPDGGGTFSVAALLEAGGPYRLSSRGPSRCGAPAFPTLAAPGADLPMASTGGPMAYVRGDGTSLSAGLVGGAAALLLQAAPETDPELLEQILVRSSRDVGALGRDDATGSGAVDLEAALALLTAKRFP
jgi:subtilisin family serine protease